MVGTQISWYCMSCSENWNCLKISSNWNMHNKWYANEKDQYTTHTCIKLMIGKICWKWFEKSTEPPFVCYNFIFITHHIQLQYQIQFLYFYFAVVVCNKIQFNSKKRFYANFSFCVVTSVIQFLIYSSYHAHFMLQPCKGSNWDFDYVVVSTMFNKTKSIQLNSIVYCFHYDFRL